MPDHPMLVASERQRLILNFPPWQAPAHLPGQAGKPHSQLPADAAPTATSPARDPLRPLLWLARREGQLLLVNESGDDLHAVRAEPYGYHLRDRMRLQVAGEGDGYEYRQVPPGGAVLVAAYGPGDRDVICGVRLAVQAPHLGCLAIHPPTAKGGVEETVLIWAHGGSPGQVTVMENPCDMALESGVLSLLSGSLSGKEPYSL
ncbi:MAG: hypothetical protein NHG36_15180 [Chromatiaceae bacterium]|nr:hypothetical protein [Candidatus Thioaporhodococcus sediminis]